MNLMNMVRLCGVLAIGWTLMAVGAGALGIKEPPPQATNFFLPRPALHEVLAVSRPELWGQEEYRLVDRSTGRAEPLPLPENENWELLSVSPWRDREGNLEAVGRWSRINASGDQAFCGLGLFRLSDKAVVARVDLDVLPTGRPCWIPRRPGELLFPAGDGQLYRCRLTGDQDARGETSNREKRRAHSGRSALPRPVAWRSMAPGSLSTFLCDPVWSSQKELRRFVFVSLSQQRRAGLRRVYEPSKIWWLEMNERGDEILAAGRLTRPEANAKDSGSVVERMPNVTAGSSGRLTLAFLIRGPGDSSWKLSLAPFSLEEGTGKPVIGARQEGLGEVATALSPTPLMFSTDGQVVFAAAAGGRIKKISVPVAPDSILPVGSDLWHAR